MIIPPPALRLSLVLGVIVLVLIGVGTWVYLQPKTSGTAPVTVATSSVDALVPAAPVATELAQTPVPTPTPKPTSPAPVKPTTPKPVTPPVVVVPPAAPATSTAPIGTTTLAVSLVPLLSGGTTHPGSSVPISYLQITNTGKAATIVYGFHLVQNGTAPDASVSLLTTVDDKSTLRSQSEALPFESGKALVPTNAFFAPGQRRLFTIKATIGTTASSYVGTQLKIDVTSVDTAATVTGHFPIVGTTWTIQ